jgi:RNA-directed DNA polymerase
LTCRANCGVPNRKSFISFVSFFDMNIAISLILRIALETPDPMLPRTSPDNPKFDPVDVASMRSGLLTASSYGDISKALGVNESTIRQLAESRDLTAYYVEFTIPKRSTGDRTIFAPRRELKAIQRRIAAVLNTMARPDEAVHGYVPARSIRTNAAIHVGQRMVITYDLENFFPTIHFGRIRGLLSSKAFGFSAITSRVLAHLCCLKGELPVGAPTSPVLSNVICFSMDRRLSFIASKCGARYSRYADDLTFSVAVDRLPPMLGVRLLDGTLQVSRTIERVISESGFRLNVKKSRVRSRNGRQCVTGITVNERLNVSRDKVRNVRAMLVNWEKGGYDNCNESMALKYSKHRRQGVPEYAPVLIGKIAYLASIRGTDDPLVRKLEHRLDTLRVEDAELPKRYRLVTVRKRADSTAVPLAEKLNEPQLFVSYSRSDEAWLNKILAHIRPVFRQKEITWWVDSENLRTGETIDSDILDAIGRSRAALLLISPEFNDSNYISRVELPELLRRRPLGLRLLVLNLTTTHPEATHPELAKILHLWSDPLDTIDGPGEPNKTLAAISHKILQEFV